MWLGHRLSNLRAAWGPPHLTPPQLESHRLLASPAFPHCSSGHGSHSCTGTCIVLGEQEKGPQLPPWWRQNICLSFSGAFPHQCPPCPLPEPRLCCHPVSQNEGLVVNSIEQLVQPPTAPFLLAPPPPRREAGMEQPLASTTSRLLHFSPPLS